MSEKGREKHTKGNTPTDGLESLRLAKKTLEQLLYNEQLLRKNQEIALNKANRELAEKVAILEKASQESRNSRRAALNLMEDAIFTKESLRQSEEKYRTLFESVDDGFVIIELIYDDTGTLVDFIYRENNPAFIKHVGADLRGKRRSELALDKKDFLLEKYEQVVTTGEPVHFEYSVQRSGVQWFEATVARIGGDDSSQVGVIFRNVTERKQREQFQEYIMKLNDALQTLADPFEIQRIAMRTLGEQLQVDRVLYAEVDDDGKTYNISDNYVREGYPKLLGRFPTGDFGAASEGLSMGEAFAIENMTLDERLSEKVRAAFIAFDVYASIGVPLIKAGRWVANLGIQHGQVRQWTAGDMALVKETAERTWAAVERAKAEKALRASEENYRTLFETMSQAFQENEIIRDENGNAIDHMLLSANPQFERLTGLKLKDFIGVPVRQIFPDSEDFWLELFDRVARSGIAERHEHRHAALGRWYNVYVFSIKGDRVGVLFDDITERIEREEREREAEALYRVRLEQEVKERTAELRASRSLLQATLDSNVEMIQVFEAVRDDKGKIVDFTWVLNNATSERFYGDVIGKSLLENNPGVVEAGIFEHFVNAVETGVPQQYEKHYIQEQFDGWFYQSVVKLNDGVATNTVNITERKKAELELKESRDRLQSLLDTTLVQMSILEAVRDGNNQITDLRIKAVNRELEKETGRRDLVGKLYAQEYPGIKQTGLFDLIVKTIETGEPRTTEYFYPHEGFQKWFACMFVKFGDGVVATNMDISARKLAEEERFKNYLLLQQSEDIALMGTWEFNLLTKSFTWSDGMYRLFDLEKGKEVSPEIYLQHVTEGGRPGAERLIRHIRNGDSDFEETLELSISGKIRVLHLKATVVRNIEGHAERVLGVDLDITAMRQAEEKIKKMEQEQQLEIFRTSLATLEEERYRISESLHNGIGQILYGIKINMAGFRHDMSLDDLNENKSYVSQLLTDAIVETRRISHELMPTTLEQFGLKSAIDDICHQLSGEVVFTCNITGLHRRMEKYLKLAVYRTTQELMTNVVKHAKATVCHVKIRIGQRDIVVNVHDNGQGIEENKMRRSGIGLASIRSKIKLLNGKVDIDSQPGKGTRIDVTIPKPQIDQLDQNL